MSQIRFDADKTEYDRSWEIEWQDMPEFKQETKNHYAEVIVKFEIKEDLETFAKLIDQNISEKTKSIWYPKLQRGECSLWRWIDES